MPDLLKKTMRADPASMPEEKIELVAEGALMMQEQLCRDLISLAEESMVRKSDARLKRAKAIFEKLK
jgi:hypothetical protein